MRVYIQNMEKPKSCGLCQLCLNDSRIANGYCMFFHRTVNMMELDKACPLIEIVECKDCKYWADDMSGNMWCEHAIGGLTEANDFCSYGERKEE